jgi:hypothetical protein
MSNLNLNLRIPTKSWKKIQDFVSWEEKCLKIHKACLNNFFWFKIFITNTLICANVYKMHECDNNQMPYCNIYFKKNHLNFWKFWATNKTWPTLDKFYYFHFYDWKNTYILKAHIKFETNCFHLTWRKKVKCKIGYWKSEEKGEFGSLWSESLGFKCGTPIMLRLVPQF